MQTKIAKWGNSLAVRIPKALVGRSGLAEGESMDIEATEEGFLLRRRASEEEYTLEELLAQWPEGGKSEEPDWGPAQGEELW